MSEAEITARAVRLHAPLFDVFDVHTFLVGISINAESFVDLHVTAPGWYGSCFLSPRLATSSRGGFMDSGYLSGQGLIPRSKIRAVGFIAERIQLSLALESVIEKPVAALRFHDLLQKVAVRELSRNRKAFDTHFQVIARRLAQYFGHLPLPAVTPRLIEEFQADRLRTVVPSTVNKEVMMVGKCFKLAVRYGLFNDNPVKRVDLLPEEDTEIRYLSEAERSALLAQCHGDLLDWVMCLMRTGLRPSEMKAVTKRDIDFQRSIVWVRTSKNGRARPARFPADVRLIFSRRCFGIEEDRHVFRTKAGKGIKAKQPFKTAFATALRKSQVKWYCMKDLRHQCATDMLEAGCTIHSVAKQLGHKDIKLTLKYYGALTDKFQKREFQLYESYIEQHATP